jgi:predicted XRE-type DNA-binding protein
MSATTTKARRRGGKSRAAVHQSSGNVFADLGLADPQHRMAKAQLARQLCALIEAAQLSQSRAAARLGVDQPKVSALLRGDLKQFSTERLIRFITAMDRDVVISIRPPRDQGRPALRVLADA